MLYSYSHMATVGVKALIMPVAKLVISIRCG